MAPELGDGSCPAAGAARSTPRLALIWAFLVAALAAFAYRGALTHDFTGGDTVALIEVSRVASFDDLQRVLTQPMLPIVTKFYRPTAALSYALDDALWGFDAFGFHVTDVAIHAFVSALIVLVVQRYSKQTLAAALAGAIFALHPILMETVPTATRRQDTLAGLFMLLALYWLPRGKTGRLVWIPSLAACALALGAKEGSVLLPILVLALEWLLPAESADHRPRWKNALLRASPFLVLTLLFVAWRAWILGGAGGNEQSWAWTLRSIPKLGLNTCNYFADLVYPLRVVFHPYLSATDRTIAICAALGFLCLIPAILRAWSAAAPALGRARAVRVALHLLLAVVAASLWFPALSSWLRSAIEQAYRNEGWPMLAGMIDSPRRQPLEFYVGRAFELAGNFAAGAWLVAGALFALAWRRARPVALLDPAQPRLMNFAAVWTLLHLLLFLAVQRYHAWNAYVPAIPFCIFVGLCIAEGLRRERWIAWAVGGFAVWLAAHSALVRGFDVWTENGRFNSLLMTEIARVAAEVPAGSSLEFLDLPNLNLSWQKDGPEPSSTFTLNPASLAAWVRRQEPDKRLQVEVISQRPARGPVAGIRMDSERLDDRRVVVRARVLPLLSSSGPTPADGK